MRITQTIFFLRSKFKENMFSIFEHGCPSGLRLVSSSNDESLASSNLAPCSTSTCTYIQEKNFKIKPDLLVKFRQVFRLVWSHHAWRTNYEKIIVHFFWKKWKSCHFVFCKQNECTRLYITDDFLLTVAIIIGFNLVYKYSKFKIMSNGISKI